MTNTAIGRGGNVLKCSFFFSEKFRVVIQFLKNLSKKCEKIGLKTVQITHKLSNFRFIQKLSQIFFVLILTVGKKFQQLLSTRVDYSIFYLGAKIKFVTTLYQQPKNFQLVSEVFPQIQGQLLIFLLNSYNFKIN